MSTTTIDNPRELTGMVNYLELSNGRASSYFSSEIEYGDALKTIADLMQGYRDDAPLNNVIRAAYVLMYLLNGAATDVELAQNYADSSAFRELDLHASLQYVTDSVTLTIAS